MFQAYAAKGETKDAIVQMKKALKLEPETKVCFFFYLSFFHQIVKNEIINFVKIK